MDGSNQGSRRHEGKNDELTWKKQKNSQCWKIMKWVGKNMLYMLLMVSSQKKIMSFRFVSVSRAVVQDQKVPPRRRKDRHLPIRTLVVGADDLQRPCGKQRGCFGSSPEV